MLQRLFCLAGLECAYLVYGSVRVGIVGVSRKDYTISFSFLFFFFWGVLFKELLKVKLQAAAQEVELDGSWTDMLNDIVTEVCTTLGDILTLEVDVGELEDILERLKEADVANEVQIISRAPFATSMWVEDEIVTKIKDALQALQYIESLPGLQRACDSLQIVNDADPDYALFRTFDRRESAKVSLGEVTDVAEELLALFDGLDTVSVQLFEMIAEVDNLLNFFREPSHDFHSTDLKKGDWDNLVERITTTVSHDRFMNELVTAMIDSHKTLGPFVKKNQDFKDVIKKVKALQENLTQQSMDRIRRANDNIEEVRKIFVSHVDTTSAAVAVASTPANPFAPSDASTTASFAGDATTLQALMAASAARVVQATQNNAALAEQHGVAAAAFSRRAAAEIGRLREEQETLNATRAEISSLHAAAIAAAEQERDSASREIDISRAAQAAATVKHSAKMVVAENALQSRLAALGRERQRQDDAHVAGLAAYTASAEAKIAAMYAEHEMAIAANRKQFDDGIAAKEARLVALEATERDVQARAAALQKRAGEAIELNVGGQRFACSVSAFSRAPESVLAVMVAQHDSKAEPVFIDTDPTHWQHVLTYLRRGAIPFLSEFDPITLASLESDAGYFKLAELEQLCKMALLAQKMAAQAVADARRSCCGCGGGGGC